MTVTIRIASGLALSLLSLIASAAITLAVANADPQQCNDVGQTIDSYLNRHPDVRQELASKGEQESPGSPNPVLDYLNRHPDVRQHLIELSHQCVP